LQVSKPSFLFASLRYYRLGNDVAQLIAFIKQLTHSMLRKHFRFDDKTDPTTGLAQLFQTNAELVNEIRATFCSTSFFVIWRR